MTTQSEADARRQQAQQSDAIHDAQLKTLKSAYNPDALHRTLDWIGNLFGSGHSYAPSGGSRAVDWLTRQFSDPYSIGGSQNPVNYGSRKDPYGDQTGPAADAWYRNVANSPTPFGNVQYGPPAPKPVTKISSGPNIAKIVQSSMGGPSQPYIPLTQIGGAPGPGAMPGEDQRQTGAWPPPMGPNPADMGGAAGLNVGDPYPSQQPPVPGQPIATPVPVPGAPRKPSLTGLGNSLGSIFGLTAPEPGGLLDRYTRWRRGDSPFGTGEPARAQGGPVGLMRGGYPELYGSQGAVRHTFDSGGQNYVDQGSSSGRADDVNAKLSPKEYVMDAESMALLGDGNPDHGAQKMDEMRANLRRDKGRALAKGKFSPKAKSAQEYLAGNPMGDGLRRRGRDKG